MANVTVLAQVNNVTETFNANAAAGEPALAPLVERLTDDLSVIVYRGSVAGFSFDGRVRTIATGAASLALGTAITFDGGNGFSSGQMARLDDTHVLIAFCPFATGGTWKLAVITLDGTNAPTVGTITTLATNSHAGTSPSQSRLVALSATTALFVGYTPSGPWSYSTIITISGTSISSQTAADLFPMIATQGAQASLLVALDSTHVLLGYSYVQSPNERDDLIVLTVGASVTAGTPLTFYLAAAGGSHDFAGFGQPKPPAKILANGHVLIQSDTSATLSSVTISGTTITVNGHVGVVLPLTRGLIGLLTNSDDRFIGISTGGNGTTQRASEIDYTEPSSASWLLPTDVLPVIRTSSTGVEWHIGLSKRSLLVTPVNNGSGGSGPATALLLGIPFVAAALGAPLEIRRTDGLGYTGGPPDIRRGSADPSGLEIGRIP